MLISICFPLNCSVFWEENMQRASLELGLNEVSYLVSPFRSELLCFFENSFFFFQILFFTTLKKKKPQKKQVPAGACNLAEIYQINVSYALLSLEVNQEVALIHLTTRWIFIERPFKRFFCNVSLKILSMGCSWLWHIQINLIDQI